MKKKAGVWLLLLVFVVHITACTSNTKNAQIEPEPEIQYEYKNENHPVNFFDCDENYIYFHMYNIERKTIVFYKIKRHDDTAKAEEITDFNSIFKRENKHNKIDLLKLDTALTAHKDSLYFTYKGIYKLNKDGKSGKNIYSYKNGVVRSWNPMPSNSFYEKYIDHFVILDYKSAFENKKIVYSQATLDSLEKGENTVKTKELDDLAKTNNELSKRGAGLTYTMVKSNGDLYTYKTVETNHDELRKGKEVIVPDMQRFIITNKYIFYSVVVEHGYHQLWRCDLDGKNKKQLPWESNSVSFLNYDNESIYLQNPFPGENNDYKCIRLSNSGEILKTYQIDMPVHKVDTYDDYIFFYSSIMHNPKYFYVKRMKKDGTGLVDVIPESKGTGKGVPQ